MKYEYNGETYFIEDLDEEENLIDEELLADTLDLTEKLKELKEYLEETKEIELSEVEDNE